MHHHIPDVTSLLYLTADYIQFQLLASYIIIEMSTPTEDPQECTMDLSLVSLMYGA